jgi:hypothetical protein
MHLLPLSLGRLADLADRTDRTRFATSCVFLRVNPDNTFEAVATDTKVLARVTGPCVGHSSAFPASPEFAARPDGAATALIPAEFWRTAFTWGRKLAGKSRGENSPPKCVAVRVGETETAFAAANEYYQWCESVENGTGRYPPYRDVLARAAKESRDRLEVDPLLLGELLRVATDCNSDPKFPTARMESNGPQSPLRLSFARGEMAFEGILMPVTPVGDPLPRTELEKRCAELTAERDALAEEVQALKAALALARTPSLPGAE